jgi:hypothetical protein
MKLTIFSYCRLRIQDSGITNYIGAIQVYIITETFLFIKIFNKLQGIKFYSSTTKALSVVLLHF